MPYVKKAEYDRLVTAEDACMLLGILITVGALEEVPLPMRQEIGNHTYQRWWEMCFEQGVFTERVET